jgi:hypothetical protein
MSADSTSAGMGSVEPQYSQPWPTQKIGVTLPLRSTQRRALRYAVLTAVPPTTTAS